MQLHEALEYLKQIATTHADKIMNGILNGCVGTDKEGRLAFESLRPVLESLAKHPDFAPFFNAIADASRKNFAQRGASLSAILAAAYISGFIGGVQFIMDGGNTERPVAMPPDQPPQPSPPAPLAN